jgi:sterol 3beta-glucosyltransferase
MNIGIFTYGTRGDLQPYIALALELKARGHEVSIASTEDFKAFVEDYGIEFQALYGNAESMMNGHEGQAILKSENGIQLMKYYFKVLHEMRHELRQSYYHAIMNVDFIIANAMTLPIVSTIAEKLNKKMAITYFMPPVVVTSAFPLGDFDFLNFPWYNRLTYKIAQTLFWKFVKEDTNEYRSELGLAPLKENLIHHLDRQKILDLYCISPNLIPQPNDWEAHHKITGFMSIKQVSKKLTTPDDNEDKLVHWITDGSQPIYIGFGSNGIGNTQKFIDIILSILSQTNNRILFCTGWSQFDALPYHRNLYVTKYVDHEAILPLCKIGIFHGGAGTLATMLRHSLPVIIVSFYTDQPTWGKIVERKKLGIHIPLKKLDPNKMISAIAKVQSTEIKQNVSLISEIFNSENGSMNAAIEIENYFNNLT